MDYDLFTFRACLDWIELEIQLARQTNAQTIRRRLNLTCFVKPINPGQAGESNRFRLLIQDPGRWTEVLLWVDKFNDAFPLVCHPLVTSIEVAFDGYSSGATKAQMQELTADFYKFSIFTASDNHRFSGRFKGDTAGILNAHRTLKMIQQDRVIYIGNDNDDISQRIYFKQTDHKKSLPELQHRARMEIILRGNALPFRTIEDGQAYDFRNFKSFFKFRKLKEGLTPQVETVARYMPLVGTKAKRSTQDQSFRLFDRNTIANSELNQTAYDALKGLTRSLNSRAPQGRRSRAEAV